MITSRSVFLKMRDISDKFVEKNKTNILWSKTLFFNGAFYEIMRKNIVQPDRPQLTTWRMRIPCWMTKATNTQSQYIILIAFSLQQWLHERASLLCYSTCLVLILLQVIILVIFHEVFVLQPSCFRRLCFKTVLLQEILISEQSITRGSEFYDTLVVKDSECSKQVLQAFILQALCWRSILSTVLLQSPSRTFWGC